VTVGARRLAFPPEMVRGDGGVRIAAYRFGGDGPPVMLVHATGFHAHVWLPMLERLCARYSLFAFDLRGHGESDKPSDVDAYHYQVMARDLLAVADHFRLARFAGLGHSVGGALLVAAEIARPGTVTRAVLFEPIVLPPELAEETPAAAAARARRTEFASTDEMMERWSSRGPFASFDPEALRAYIDYGVRDRADGGVELKCAREAEVSTFVNDTRTGIWTDLDRYRTPTLIVAGDRSTSRAAPIAERQAEAMIDAHVERHADLSHFLPFERPRAMAERAIAFIGC
jgi:pimeloyl-ACP methyl ester carboxylesterase